MSTPAPLRPLFWEGSAKKDSQTFPAAVKDTMGYALELAQRGEKHIAAKPLRGFGGAGVLEVVDDYDGDTYRAVYTVRLRSGVYVLHTFQKESHGGVRTDPQDIALVRRRLRDAEAADARGLGGETR